MLCFHAGKFLMMQYPIFATVLAPLSPFARLYFSVPFFPLIVFFAVYIGIVNNQSLDRSVRYNAMQAILLDIILMCDVFPMLVRFCGRVTPVVIST